MSGASVTAGPAAAAAAAAAGGAAGAAAGADGAQPAAGGGWSFGSIARMLMMYWVVSTFMKGSNTNTNNASNNGKDAVATTGGGVGHPHRPMWMEHTPYDMYVYVTPQQDFDLQQYTATGVNPTHLLWSELDLRFGWDPLKSERALNWTFVENSWPMKQLQSNGTLFAHTYFVKDRTPLFKYRRLEDSAASPSNAASSLHTDAEGAIVAIHPKTGQPIPEPHEVEKIPSATSAGFTQKYVKNTGFNERNIVHRSMQLNMYRPAPKKVDKKNLLGVGNQNASTEVQVREEKEEEVNELPFEDEEDNEIQPFGEDDADEFEGGNSKGVATRNSKGLATKKRNTKEKPWISLWKPFISIRLIPDFTVFPYKGIPAEMEQDFKVDPQTSMYEPVVYFDYFWLLREHLIPINNTVTSLSLNLTHSPLSLLKWRLEAQMETSWQMQQSWGMQEEDGRESEMFKRMVMDTNIYLLVLTFAVSMLHMVFDFLAFKNDVKFWKEAKSMRGLSTRSILMNSICQVIIFLYLLDNDTSYMILGSNAVGLVIEFWKVNKALVIKFDRSLPFPYIKIMNKSLSEEKKEEEKTEEEKELELHSKYDAEAMTYLSYALYPLVLCYAGYSLYYESHKSWYSFILAVLTGCVYTFGFIMMCPQLYMNYKLKSVAHLPWRMLTYKALNTFIDDLFAFVISMPTLHRLACFRDDVIFFIFLYQKYIYRVDFKRVNEFGTVLMSEEEQEKLMEAEKKKLEEDENNKSAVKRDEEMKERKVKEQENATAAVVEETTEAEEPAVDDSASSEGIRQRTTATTSSLSEMD